MTRPSVIVVGTGRSGTSSVARILHERLGVCMGHHLKMQHPGGAYEDYLAHGLNRMVAANVLSATEWLRVMSECHGKCESWGAKDPWFFYWTPEQLRFLSPVLVVRTWRSREEVTVSWLEMRRRCDSKEPPSEMRKHFELLYDDRELRAKALEQQNGLDVMTIKFDRLLSDDEIASQISERMKKKC